MYSSPPIVDSGHSTVNVHKFMHHPLGERENAGYRESTVSRGINDIPVFGITRYT